MNYKSPFITRSLPKITKGQLYELNAAMIHFPYLHDVILEQSSIDSLEELPAHRFDETMKLIELKKLSRI